MKDQEQSLTAGNGVATVVIGIWSSVTRAAS